MAASPALPPLPAKKILARIMPGDYRYGAVYGYTSYQLRKYGEACRSPSSAEGRSDTAARVVAEQADDDALWFAAETITEAHLQAALRRLHAAVEADAAARKLLAEQGVKG